MNLFMKNTTWKNESKIIIINTIKTLVFIVNV